MSVEAEINELQRRVVALEGAQGFLSGQVHIVHLDILGAQERTQKRFDRTEHRVDKLESEFQTLRGDVNSLRTDVGSLRSDVQSLRHDLPAIVGNAVRDAFDKK